MSMKQCAKCKRDETEVDMETMPCCGAPICWDFCLYEEPKKCPVCGSGIRVEPKDEVTGEAYVEVIEQKPKKTPKTQLGINISEAKERFGELLGEYLIPDKVLTGDAQKLKRRLIKFCKVELQMRVK